MNLTFGISESIKNLLPKARLGIVFSIVEIKADVSLLHNEIDNVTNNYEVELVKNTESKLEIIAETRKAYKICGKEPSRYRPSAEALLRRVRTGKGLYKINNVVDTINLLSMSSTYSIGGFDVSNIEGQIILDIGNEMPYRAIGRGDINVEFMPGIRDDHGFFGTPTSDSERTMVTDEIRQLLMVYYDFFGNVNLESSLEQASSCLQKYCNATDISQTIIH